MDNISELLELLVLIIELVSAGILLVGFMKAGISFIRQEGNGILKRQSIHSLSDIRLTLGTYILLGLDFYIVSDIIHSMIKPQLNELINLALIVVMRTTIGFFLSREIADIETSQRVSE